MSECMATMESVAVQNHVHKCSVLQGPNHPPEDDHFCSECGRFFWVRGKANG